MRNIILLCLSLCVASCSHYDWSSAELIFFGAAPIVSAGSDLNLTDADNLDAPITIPVTISDSDTNAGNLSMTWTGNINDPAPVSASIVNGVHSLMFPRNGTYQLTLNVDDGTHVTQDSIIVTVNSANYFAFAGRVQDNLANVAGLDVELRFTDGTVLETVVTDTSGSYRFDNIIGAVSNYEIVVKN